MPFQFMASACLYFPLTREWPEMHLLENRRQHGRGGPGRGRKPSACQPSWISFHLPARLGTRTAVSCVLEPQQLSSDAKAGFHPAWCCPCLPSLTRCPTSFAPAPDSSECLARGGERELCWGQRLVLTSLPDQFGVVFLALPWKRCLQSQKRECVWHSAAARCGEERDCILPGPSSHCGERWQS